MSMEMVASRALYRQRHATGGDLRALANRALLRRIWQFSARHHRRLGGFVAVSVVGALLAVSTPVLAGRVVDAIVHNGRPATGGLIAAGIAPGGHAQARVGVFFPGVSSQHREGPVPHPRGPPVY